RAGRARGRVERGLQLGAGREAVLDAHPVPGAGASGRRVCSDLPVAGGMVTNQPVAIAHVSDLHFGGYADLAQIEALEDFLPTLGVGATVVSGDLSQRARHGEFQAAHAFLNRIRDAMPVLVVPGNHDLEWWRSPLGPIGSAAMCATYSRYFGPITPV